MLSDLIDPNETHDIVQNAHVQDRDLSTPNQKRSMHIPPPLSVFYHCRARLAHISLFLPSITSTSNPTILHTPTKHTTTTPLPSLRLTLHLLANLDIDLEELSDAAIQAHGFALVQICLAVRCVDAFCGAGFEEAIVMVELAHVDVNEEGEWWGRG